MVEGKKPMGYWTDERCLETIKEIGKQLGLEENQVPTSPWLRKNGYAVLVSIINRRHRNYQEFIEYAGLFTQVRRTRGSGFYTDGQIIEIVKNINKNGGFPENQWPTGKQFKSVGHLSAQGAIRAKHGNIRKFAESNGFYLQNITLNNISLGLDEVNVLVSRIKELNLQKGLPENQLPTTKQLKHWQPSILRYIYRAGGMEKFAQTNGFYLQEAKFRGYWSNPLNAKVAIEKSNLQNGFPKNRMPTSSEMRDWGIVSFITAFKNVGGIESFAREYGFYLQPISLAYASKIQSSTHATILSIFDNLDPDRTEMMLLLRKAGSLDTPYKVSHVSKLLESRAAQTDSEGDTSGILETLDLPTPRNGLTVADIAKEQAALDAPSKLAEMGITLDDTLMALFVRKFWKSFYKRLYFWQKSLSVTGKVSRATIEQAILGVYPNHADDENVKRVADRFIIEVEQAVKFARKLDATGWIGPKPYFYQAHEGHIFSEVISSSSRKKIAPFKFMLDEPGLGKTFTTLSAIVVAGASRNLIIAPPGVADDKWLVEIAKFIPAEKLEVYRGHKAVTKALLANRPAAPGVHQFYVLHYHEITDQPVFVQLLAEQAWDCVCVDEAHDYKNNEALRSQALASILKVSKANIGITGTPLINSVQEPVELFKLFSSNAPAYHDKFASIPKLKNGSLADMADVYEMMLPHIVRHLKSDVLFELPGNTKELVYVPIDRDTAAEMLDCYYQPRLNIASIQKVLIDPKIDWIVDYCKNIPGKILVFDYYENEVGGKVYERLQAELGARSVGYVSGTVEKAERQTILNAFRSDGNEKRILVATIDTSGLGIELFDPESESPCCKMVFADLPYTWAKFEQAVARLDRNGQKNMVEVKILLTTTDVIRPDGNGPELTIDEAIWQLIQDKKSKADVVVDGLYTGQASKETIAEAIRKIIRHQKQSDLKAKTA